jgi:hypothetical protein
MRARFGRVLAAAVVVIWAALPGAAAASGLPAVHPPLWASPVAAAPPPELQIAGDARYEVQPDQRRVRVTFDATVTNRHHDTGSTRTYFDTAYLAVLPGSSGFAISSTGATPVVSITSRVPAYTLLAIRLGRRLYAGRHASFRLQFDLKATGGTGQRDVRVGTSLAAFPVWAFATAATPGGSVTVVVPQGFTVQQQAGSLAGPTAGPSGSLVFRSGPIATPLAFYAYVIADRPGAFKQIEVSAPAGGATVHVTIRAWVDDPAWGARVAALVRRGLPALATAVGLPYPGTDLVVQESVSRAIGGYAGVFDPAAGTVQVAYYAQQFVVLHETAHAWFNGRLASERWVLEGFASWYAQQAAAALKIDTTPPALTKTLRAAAIPLNDWPAVGRAGETTEDYAYAATFALADLIARRAGPAGLRAVWEAAASGESAYKPVQPEATRELGAAPPDWRGLIDLLEERTPRTYADLWQKWVVRPAEAPLLDQRSAARKAYAGAVREAGAWELPAAIRRAMSAWQFDTATALIAQSHEALAARTAVVAAVTAEGLSAPPTLRRMFEGPDGPAQALAEARNELDTVQALAAARAARREADGIVAQVGLLDVSPEAELAAARLAFGAGDLPAARDHAAAAQAIWQGADGRGRGRLISIAVVIGGLAVIVAGLVAAIRMRRAREIAPDA